MPPLTQSAATMAQYNATKYQTRCSPIDNLLDGGLKRGFVLELSGPPGTCKENLTLGVVQEFIDNNQGVLFVGVSFVIAFTATRLTVCSFPLIIQTCRI